MRRHDRPDSSHVDDERDITQQFWGAAPGWTDQPDRPRPPSTPRARRRDDTTGAIAAIRDGFAAFRPQLRTPASNDATGEIDRTRSHGIVRPGLDDQADPTGPAEPTAWDGYDDEHVSYSYVDAPDDHIDLDDDAAFWGAAETGRMPAMRRDRTGRHPAAVAAPASHGDRLSLAAVDPLLLRVGIFILALVVLFPLAWAMRSDDAGTVTTGTAAENPAASVETTVIAAPVPETTIAPPLQPAPAAGQEAPAAAPVQPAPAAESSSSSGSSGSSGSSASSSAGSDSSSGSAESSSSGSGSQSNAVEPPEEETDPTVVASGIDDEPAAVDEPADRVEPDCSQIYLAQPGDSWFSIAEAAGVTPTDLISANQATFETVILPGAEICLPAEATVPPQTTTTTAAPTTTTTEPEDSSEIPETSPEEVQQLIRDIWPDDLEEKALEVAFRESRYQHDAYNGWCCYGVFQIYWTVHQSWLDDYEIYRAEDLFHARKNIEAAYALYQAAGGWSPWSQTAY